MRIFAFLVAALILAGCGASASIQHLATDNSGQDPVLQVWCKAKRLEQGADSQIVVGWNKRLGTGPVNAADLRSDGTLVVKVTQWQPTGSDWDRSNEMRVEFLYEGKVLAKRVLPAPTDFANAYERAQSKPADKPADAPK